MSSRCITPFNMRNKVTGEWMALPCGRCPPCLNRRASGWSFRLYKQGEVSKTAHFVTLTYDTKHVPITKNGFMTLLKTDVQKYFKRLRKLHEENDIKYYLCGEYGGKTERPHYHIILFNADPLKIENAWSYKTDKNTFSRIGTIYIGEVTGASIGYTLKYMSKKRNIPKHKNDDRQKEFSLMSKGLGVNYLTNNMKNWHLNDLENRMYVPRKGGEKIAMPRYYKDKIYSETQKLKINTHLKSVLSEQQQLEETKLIEEFGEYAESILVQRHKQIFKNNEKNSENGRNTI